MKVIGINGSPRPNGNTYLTIKAFLDEIEKEGLETELLQIGSKIEGCRACGKCRETGQCQISDEKFRTWSEKILETDGLFLASPVYFGSMPGAMKSFLDRFFYQCLGTGKMYHKVGSAMAILRRSGGYTTVDDLNRYFFSTGMTIVSAGSVNLIHGQSPGEVLQDTEGMDAVIKLAGNMAWILKMMEATKKDIQPPSYTQKPRMNFIR